MGDFLRLAIVERGEPAMRALNAVAELDRDGGAPRPTTIAVYAEPDARSWFVREADEAVGVGAQSDPDGAGGFELDRLVATLRAVDADAVWAGWGPLADDPDFAERCERAGIVFVGPDSATIRLVRDPAALRRLADGVGLSVVVDGAVPSTGRMVEIDVVRDGRGTTWSVGARECSVRRAGQPVVEESAATALDAATDQEVRAAAVRMAEAAGLRGVSAVGFLVDPSGKFWLTAVRPGLSAGHALTEMVSGLDLVKLQLRLARGDRLDGVPPAARGHAIQVRLAAADPEHEFRPAPGRVVHFRLPASAGIRVDAGVVEGDVIAAELGGTIASVTGWGRDRREALARLRRALAQAAVILDNGQTTKAFLLALLDRPEVHTAEFDAGWLDRLVASGEHLPAPSAIALVHAAVEAYDVDHAAARAAFYASAARGRPEVPEETGHRMELRMRGVSYPFTVFRRGQADYRVATPDGMVDARLERVGPYESRLTCRGRTHRVIAVARAAGFGVEVDGVAHEIVRDDGGVLRSAAPAFVVAVLVEPGDQVQPGDPLAVLETMKMESTLAAPFAGRVSAVLVGENVQVDAGAPLLQVRPVRPAGPSAQRRLEFGGIVTPKPAQPGRDQVFDAIRAYLLGFDLDAASVGRMLADHRTVCATAAPDDPELMAREDEILDLFADVGALYRPQPDVEDAEAEPAQSAQEYLLTYLAWLDPARSGVPERFQEQLRHALGRYGVSGLDRTPELEEALVWMFRSFRRLDELVPVVTAILERRLEHRAALAGTTDPRLRAVFERIVTVAQGRQQTVADLASEAEFRYFDEPVLEQTRRETYAEMDLHLQALQGDLDPGERARRLERLVRCPQPMRGRLRRRYVSGDQRVRRAVLEVHVRRFYRIRPVRDVAFVEHGETLLCTANYDHEGRRIHLVVLYTPLDRLPEASVAIARHLAGADPTRGVVVDVAAWRGEPVEPVEAVAAQVERLLAQCEFGRRLHRLDVTVTSDGPGPEHVRTHHLTYRQPDREFVEELLYRNLHPLIAKRLSLWRLSNFALRRLASVEDVYVFAGVAHDNPKDERLFALAEVRDLTTVRDEDGRIVSVPHLERMTVQALAAMRQALARQSPRTRPLYNQVNLYVRPLWELPADLWRDLAHRLAPLARGLGLEKLVVRVTLPDPKNRDGRRAVFDVENISESGVSVRLRPREEEPIPPMTEYRQKVLRSQRMGAPYPYELIRMITPPADVPADFPAGEFQEHDLDVASGQLVTVDRPAGRNGTGLVAGVVTNYTATVPEGMSRVVLIGDPTKSLGALTEAECRRVIAGLDLAERMGVPLEWFALSAGARISMSSGTENMDWVASALRRLITFTQAGGEVNVVVTGINVGAQPYWNAEATMLMHTRGILVMTPDSAMVLTGKQALDFSGGVSAEDNFGIGGYERVMGPNGQGQYWAPSVQAACGLLFRHYEHTYVVPGERFPRRAQTADPVDRDVRTSAHAPTEGSDFTLVGDVFSMESNPERKKPFDIRSVMRSVADQDHPPLERWARWADAENAVVWDAHVGGLPVCLLGLESHTVPRRGFVPADGPSSWTSGTLFPQASRKVARAVNAASGNRPLVVLANLSGFDGSPESMRKWQLEYGAEIGRAVTNFRGPIVFVVVSRYHGGAFVVFSKRLNDHMEIAAVEGSRASVIGGAPAAGVVFAREVSARTEKDPRVVMLREEIAATGDVDRLSARLARVVEQVHAEKLGEVADEFDRVHSVHRAQQVGSVDRIIPARSLRPYVVDALERLMRRFTA